MCSGRVAGWMDGWEPLCLCNGSCVRALIVDKWLADEEKLSKPQRSMGLKRKVECEVGASAGAAMGRHAAI